MSPDIIIYQTEDGHTKIDVRMDEETVWLTQVQMADLLQATKHVTFGDGTILSHRLSIGQRDRGAYP